ncbi:MAG: hypothetical protein H7318_09775 [Oligoflexus sp.]|nr:hypothetical protein [Oligoflexus sp.]
MQRFLKFQLLASIASLSLSFACKEDRNNPSTSAVKSDWEEIATEGKSRSYAIDWACEPKRYGAASEKTIKDQEEYCEWKVVKTTATEKTCRFTTSFDETRDFYLNSRGKTPINSIGAARYLVDLCTKNATEHLEAGKTAGALCAGIPEGCVDGRNSDPEICTKVRWATGERFAGNIDFCVDKLIQRDSIILDEPLMQFGLLSELPENCTYATEDHTEVVCTVPVEDTCFSVAGQLRPGMRVQTKAKADTIATLPVARECYVP